MRRDKTQKRGRVRSTRLVQVLLFQVLMIGGIGYLIGGWSTPALRGTALSAAESVALRFPQNWNKTTPVSRTPIIAATAASLNASPNASATGDVQLALFSPEPMVPANRPQTTLPSLDTQATLQSASLAPSQAVTQMATLVSANEPTDAAPVAAAQQASEPRASTPIVRRHVVNRPGYMLNDAQIASIKTRLNLTPDQERMWPAVEAALRNITYTHAQDARGRAIPGTAAQTAAVDPNAVQGLKSAAVPLIMSFNSEQKDEVRSIVHVMGLDQLASQF
jgi:hypothetical protein